MQPKALEVLKQAGFDPYQAFVRAIELEIAAAKDTLATKHDILLLRQDLEVGRADPRREMSNTARTCAER